MPNCKQTQRHRQKDNRGQLARVRSNGRAVPRDEAEFQLLANVELGLDPRLPRHEKLNSAELRANT